MIDPLAIQRADETADVLPRYDVRFVRLNAGLSEEQTSAGDDPNSNSLAPYLAKAVEAFETDTSLKVYRHSFAYQLQGRTFVVDPERAILVPGLNCEVTSFTCDGSPVDAAAYTTQFHRPTGCAVLKPNGYWQFDRDAKLDVRFDAGLAASESLPAGVQSILAVRMRFDLYGGSSDLLRYQEERRRYTVGTIIYR